MTDLLAWVIVIWGWSYHLTVVFCRFIATMDLGILQNMDAICQKARAKMRRQQVLYHGYFDAFVGKYFRRIRL